MYISRIRLNNWRNFKEVEVSCGERVYLVGPNASGKSNFLDAVRFLRDLVLPGGGLQKAVKDRGGVSKIRCLAARKTPNPSIYIEIADSVDRKTVWSYQIEFKNTGGGIQEVAAEIVKEEVRQYHADKKPQTIISRSKDKGDDEKDPERLKFTHLEQINANKKFRDIYNLLKDIDYLHIVPHLVREQISLGVSERDDFYGRNFLERIGKINKRTLGAHLRKINEILKLAVPQLSELSYIKDKNTGMPHLEARYDHWRKNGGKQREEQFSDGTLRLIGFLWSMLEGGEIILLEEPELYLHAEIVKRLPETIIKFQHRKSSLRQVFLTTHSYDLLSSESIRPEEVLVLRPSREGTEITVAIDDGEVRDLLGAGFNSAEVLLRVIAPENISDMNRVI